MAVNFTDSPSNGATITAGGRTYTYSSSTSTWEITATTAANPSITATASGALANGDMVIINSDGTVSAVAASSVSSALGSETVFDDSTVNDGDQPTATFDSNSNKVVVAYRDGGNSNYGTAIVGTVSGTSISFGSQVVFNTSATQAISSGFDSNSNKIVLTYDARVTQTIGGSTYNKNQVTAIVGTVSGTSISFGTAVVVETLDIASSPDYSSGLSYGGSIAFDSNLNKVVISYTYRGGAYVSSTNTGWHAVARVGTVSGNSISFGSRVLFNGTKGSDGPLPLIFDSNSNKIVLAYKDGNNSDSSRTGKAIIGTVSGNSISFVNPTTITSGRPSEIDLGFDSNLNKVLAVYYDGTAGAMGAKVGTVSGTTISFGTEVTGFTTGSIYNINAIFDSNANKFVITYLDLANSWYGTLRECTISGTSLSLGSAEVFNSAEAYSRKGGVFDSNSNKVVLVYRDVGNSQKKTARVKQVSISGVTNLTANNYIGVSDAAYSDSATATIQLIGSVDDAQSGLTPGQSHYIQNDGTLSTSAGTPSVLAGTAISATKLIVKGEIAAAAAAGLLVSSSGGGVTTYANIAALPSSGNTAGDLAFVTDVKAFYGWDGTEWDRIFSGQNMLPEFTTSPAASYNLASDGTATTVTVAATDPEGFAVTYSHDTSPTNQSQATITQSGGTFTVTPSTTSSNAGTFTARFKAFDGVRTNSASSTFSLSFLPYSTGLIGYWDAGKTSSYSGSGSTWTSLVGSNETMTLSNYTFQGTAGTSGAYFEFASGSSGVGNFQVPSSIALSTKTWVFIWARSSGSLFMGISDSGSYFALAASGSATAQQRAGHSLWAGESYSVAVNNTEATTAGQFYSLMTNSKFNTNVIQGVKADYNSGNSAKWQAFPTEVYRSASDVRAVLCYDTIVTGSNLQSIHNFFDDQGVDMGTWS